MESAIVQIKCRGCGKVENETTFKACPTCIELKMMPAVYCCEECFRADWITHNKTHEMFSISKTEYLKHHQLDPLEEIASSKEYRKCLKGASEAEKMTYIHARNSIRSAMARVDYNKAEILCRKAINRFPSYPEPYRESARIFFRQGHGNDGMIFLGLSIEKACRILLTTKEKKRGNFDEFCLSHYVLRRDLLLSMAMWHHYLPKYWIFDEKHDEKKTKSVFWFYFAILQDKNSFPGDVELLDPKSVYSLIESRITRTRDLSSSPYFDGEWVIAHGLASSVGKTLNHKVAMVKRNDLNEEGRVAVVFKEGGPIKYLKVENLKRARTVNAKAALLFFLDEPEQWKFMMNDFLSV